MGVTMAHLEKNGIIQQHNRTKRPPKPPSPRGMERTCPKECLFSFSHGPLVWQGCTSSLADGRRRSEYVEPLLNHSVSVYLCVHTCLFRPALGSDGFRPLVACEKEKKGARRVRETFSPVAVFWWKMAISRPLRPVVRVQWKVTSSTLGR